MYLPPDVCIYILCTSTKCRLCTTPVVSLPFLPHNPPPISPFLSPPGRPQADGSPFMCRGSAKGSFLTNREFFLARVAIVLALRGFQALGSVKRLEIIVLLWRYINKIEL